MGRGQVATILTAVFSFIGMLVSGWGEQVDSVQGSDAPIYIVFGMYIPVVLVLFSLAPRFIATAEMGCIKQLETLCTPFWVYLYDGTARKKAVFSAQKTFMKTVHYLPRQARDRHKRTLKPWRFFTGETPNGAAYLGGAIIVSAVIGHSIATIRAGPAAAADDDDDPAGGGGGGATAATDTDAAASAGAAGDKPTNP